jgi:hypothetical protein
MVIRIPNAPQNSDAATLFDLLFTLFWTSEMVSKWHHLGLDFTLKKRSQSAGAKSGE